MQLGKTKISNEHYIAVAGEARADGYPKPVQESDKKYFYQQSWSKLS